MEDFDDMETDERVNTIPESGAINQLSKELEWFPDPLNHCIGFIIEEPGAYVTNVRPQS